MSCLLVVDSGNTRIKWGLRHGERWLRQGAIAQKERIRLQHLWQELLVPPERAVVANVAGEEARQDLLALFSRWGIESDWAVAAAYQCGVSNAYVEPGKLGIDRWAALIAAWHRCQKACLVVNMGTALTVDAVSDGQFMGGVIVPGFDLLQKTLTGNTASLAYNQGKFCDFPDNTDDAIFSGAVHALSGAIGHMYEKLAAAVAQTPDCIATGGAMPLLLPHMKLPVTVVDNLVLEGLVLITSETDRHVSVTD